MKHLKKTDYETTAWSGGTTQQIYIYPRGSEVANRDFYFRISSAQIEAETSEFTPFLDYTRILMPLDTGITIQHGNEKTLKLEPLDQDCFSGSEWTTSQGKCTDFNFIFRPGFHGSVKVIHLQENENWAFEISASERFKLVFIWKGELIEGVKKYSQGESLILENTVPEQLAFVSSSESILILVQIPTFLQ